MVGVLEALSMDELEEEIDDDSSVTKAAKNPILKLTISMVLVAYGVFNIVFDWLWIDDMLKARKGLVFGVPGQPIVATMIFIATIGTLSFLFEILCGVWEAVRGNVIVHEDINQILCLFLEEVPEVTLNFLLASCREVPLSVFQMIKAALAMVGAGIRCLKVLIKFLTVKRKGGKKGLIPFILRVLILAACAYLLAAAILIWIFTYSPQANEDGSGIRVPPDLTSSSYDSARYLYKSGFYFSYPDFHHCNHDSTSVGPDMRVSREEDWEQQQRNWLRVQLIMDFEASQDENMTAWYANNSTHSYIKIEMDQQKECFQTTLATCEIVKQDNCDRHWDYDHQMMFTFETLEHSETLIFGDIRVKVSLVNRTGDCHTLSIDDWGMIFDTSTAVASLQYFKSMMHVNDTEIFVEDEEGWHYFTYGDGIEKGDLFNVTEVWKTGYNKCRMTGSLAPNPSLDLPDPCPHTR